MRVRQAQLLRLTALTLACALGLAAHLRPTPSDDAAAAAQGFLESLPAQQRERARFAFDDAERGDWHFVPRERQGLPLGELAPAARAAATELFASALSARGLARVDGVIALEGLLRELESRPDRPATWRDPGAYFVSLFGEPGGAAPWGWRLEGHHLALNFTVVGSDLAVTPAFVGANPAHAHDGPGQGGRLLGREEDLARALVRGLDAEQSALAIVAERPPDDIFYGPERSSLRAGPAGLPAVRLSAEQRELLSQLVECYLLTLQPAPAEAARARLGPVEGLHFTWMGAREAGAPHYWRIDGRQALIEWDDVQNGANHVHTVWRDLERDFGLDLLVRHRRRAHSEAPTPPADGGGG